MVPYQRPHMDRQWVRRRSPSSLERAPQVERDLGLELGAAQ